MYIYMCVYLVGKGDLLEAIDDNSVDDYTIDQVPLLEGHSSKN